MGRSLMTDAMYFVCWITVGVVGVVVLPRWWRGLPSWKYEGTALFIFSPGGRVKHGLHRSFGVVVIVCWDAIAAAGLSSPMMNSKGLVRDLLISALAVFILILFVGLLAMATIIYFNWPKFLVPSRMRTQPGEFNRKTMAWCMWYRRRKNSSKLVLRCAPTVVGIAVPPSWRAARPASSPARHPRPPCRHLAHGRETRSPSSDASSPSSNTCLPTPLTKEECISTSQQASAQTGVRGR